MVRGLLIDNYQTSILKVPGLLNCLKQGVLLLETVLDKGYGLPTVQCASLLTLHSSLFIIYSSKYDKMNYDMMSMIMIGLGQPDKRQEDIIHLLSVLLSTEMDPDEKK